MSHTTKIGDTVFTHDGDFGGNVEIKSKGMPTINIPFEDLKGIVAEYIRYHMMSRLESMDRTEIIETGV